MSFQGPKNIKIGGNLGGRSRNTDAIMGMVISVPVVAGIDFTTETAYRLMSPQDAKNLGVNAAYDANNDSRLFYHISEFFRNCPGGILWVFATSHEDDFSLSDLSGFASDLMRIEEVKREPRMIGLVLDTSPVVPIYDEGFQDGVVAAIPAAQQAVESLFSESIYLDGILIEGRGCKYPLTDLANCRLLSAPNVSLVAAQDPAIVAIDPDSQNMNQHAAVGAALGMAAQRKISEDLGSVAIANYPDERKGSESYPLTDVNKGLWLSASLSDGTPFSFISLEDKAKLEEFGVIFAGKFEGYPGFYLSGSHTCIAATDDFSFIERNRVWNKAARLMRAALIPKIRSEVPVTAEGKIAPTTIADWQIAVDKKVGQMLTANEISGYSFEIVQEDEEGNPIDFLGGDPIITRLGVTPNGIAKEISNEIGFENPNNQ